MSPRQDHPPTPPLPLKASGLESGSATMNNQGPALKRKAVKEQSVNEFKRKGSTKVAKYASRAPLPSHMTDPPPRTSLLGDTPSSSQQGSAKPQGLAASRPPTITTVIEDFDYQGGGTGMNSSEEEEEEEGDDLEYPGDGTESLVRPTHLMNPTQS